MKTFLLKILLIFLAFTSFSQSNKVGYLSVTGKVKINKEPVPGAFVKVYENGTLLQEKKSDGAGKFKLKLPLNKNIILEVGKKGLVTKKIKFDTHVPETGFYWTYNFTVELFMYVEGLDISPLNQPVTVVKYNKEYDEFEYDPAYTNLMRDKLKKMMDQLAELKKKKFDELIAKGDKLCDEGKYDEAIDAYEAAIDYDPFNYLPDNKIEICERKRGQGEKIEKEYKRLIANADALFNQKRYKDALSPYKKASGLKPSEQYPKQRIEEINKILAQLKEKQKEEELNKEYNRYITLADRQFSNKQYELAKQNYNKALGIKPKEDYPKQKIAEIDAILAKQQQELAAKAERERKNKEYLAVIGEADKAFKAKNYDNAKSLYNKALTIKPDEQYPKEKIKEIDKILADLAAKEKLEKQYQATIKEADALLASKKYNDAKSKYTAASQLKPGEQYPKDKIKDIERIIAHLNSSQRGVQE